MTIPEMLRLMRLEFDRAQRHRYPIVALIMAVDPLEDLSGVEAGMFRRHVMPAIFGVLKQVAIEQKVQGLGSWTGNRQLAVFPHVAPWNIEPLVQALLENAREIEVPGHCERGAATLSIGVAHNQHSQATGFEALLREAETGLVAARQAGGDRHVQWREVENEISRLQNEIEEHQAEIKAQRQAISLETTKLSAELTEDAEAVIASIHTIFGQCEDKTDTIEKLEEEMVALVQGELLRQRQRSSRDEMAEHKRQIDMLERRIAKLTSLLANTEEELERVAAMKDLPDGGIASIYDTVQGISDGEANAELKKEMMAEIFKANKALFERLSDDGS